jgi:hypothetical protein
MSAPDPLAEIADQLRDERTPVSPHVVDSPPPAAGPPFVELVREGYLLHYGRPRLLAGHDDDLGLLAGDYLYALAIERLAAAGDVASIGILAELIGDSAQLHAEGREDEAPARWRRAAAAIATGPGTAT